jgi:SnoaL-like protein
MAPQTPDWIEAECLRVALTASLRGDASDAQGFAECFTADASFVMPSTYPGSPVLRREGLEAMINARPRRVVSRHVMSNMTVTVKSEMDVRGFAYFTHFVGALEDAANPVPLPIEGTLLSMGEYRYRFAFEEGRWLIKDLVGQFIFGGRFLGYWGSNPMPGTSLSSSEQTSSS